MSKQYREFISKPEIRFWIPIISSAVLITTSWFNITNRIDLQSQKLDYSIAQTERLLIKYETLEEKYSSLSLKVKTLETLEKIDNRSE